MVSHYLPSFARRGRRRCWVTWPQRRVTHPQNPPNAWPFQPSDRWVLPAQCPGWKTPSRSAVFLSASRRRGHFSSKMQPGRKGPAGSPSGPALHMPAASQRPCRRPRPGPHSSAHPGVSASTQHPLPFCEEQIKGLPSPRRTLPGLGSKAARVPPAPDGARAAPVDEEGGFPLCGQVDGLCIVDSLICSPAHSLPVIHSAPHSHLHPLTTHCLPD